MIKITNGDIVLTVTEGAYKMMYALQGWVKCDDMINKAAETTSGEVENANNEDFDVPISEMTVNQLKAYAEHLKIKIDAKDTAKTLRNKIRAKL